MATRALHFDADHGLATSKVWLLMRRSEELIHIRLKVLIGSMDGPIIGSAHS
jgi:hypothetical protein